MFTLSRSWGSEECTGWKASINWNIWKFLLVLRQVPDKHHWLRARLHGIIDKMLFPFKKLPGPPQQTLELPHHHHLHCLWQKKQVLQFNIKKNCQHCTSMDSEYHCGCSKIHLFQVNPVQKLRDVTCFAQKLACDVSRVPGPNEKQTNMTGMTVNALISLARPEPQPY